RPVPVMKPLSVIANLRWRRPRLARLRVLLVCLIMAAGAAASRLPAAAASGAAADGAAAKIDLNAFDALKKTIALPDGEVLAYLEMGNKAGRPVVLVHG